MNSVFETISATSFLRQSIFFCFCGCILLMIPVSLYSQGSQNSLFSDEASILFQNKRLGAKLDWATRSHFEDAVCDQDGIAECTADNLTPVYVAFGEVSLFNWDLSNTKIGYVPVSAGVSFTYSNVQFDQHYEYGAALDVPYRVSGSTGISSFEIYTKFSRPVGPIGLFGEPLLTPFARVGTNIIHNSGDFEFMSDNENFDFQRKHTGVHIAGGIGADLDFNAEWGARLNMDYTIGGADANLRFGVGLTYSFATDNQP